jgi:threonine/homoserine/homoserine lactone efflux protein
MDASSLALALLAQGAALGLSAASAPGPLQTLAISESLRGGWRRGAPIAFAPLLADIPIVLLCILVLRELPGSFVRVLSLAGGLFVLYLAHGLWRQWREGAAGSSTPVSASVGAGLGRGVLMSAASPGPYLFWTMVNGPILLGALQTSWWHGASFLTGFYAVFIGGMLSIVALFHQARRLGPGVVRALTLVSMAILVLFGALLLLRGIRG